MTKFRILILALALSATGLAPAGAAPAPEATRATSCIVWWDGFPQPGGYRTYCTSSYTGLVAIYVWRNGHRYTQIWGRSIVTGQIRLIIEDLTLW